MLLTHRWRLAVVLPAPLLATAAVLENTRLRIVFDDARGGAITSFVDKQSGRDFASGASLYELTFAEPAGKKSVVRETDGAGATVALRRTGRSQTVSIEARTHAGRPVGTSVTCSLEDGAAFASCRIRVANRSGQPLSSIRFPNLSMPIRLGDSSEDDRLLLPKCDGVLVDNPEANLRPGEERASTYPGSASVQLVAYYDGAAGLYAATHDPAGHRKALGIARGKDSLGLVLRYYPETGAREQVDVPYAAVLGVFHGDWQVAAAEYKKWAVRQPWCHKTIAERDDLPDWLKRAPFFYAVTLRGQRPDGSSGYRGDLIAQNVAEWGKVLGWPLCPMLMSWEKHGAWITPDYFPPVGGDEVFRRLTGGMREAGHTPLVFLSGLKWTLRKSIQGASQMYDDDRRFREQGAEHAIVGEDGKVQESGKPDADVGLHAQICPATPLARELLVSATLQAIDAGIPAVQVDQMVGGGIPPCYSTRHGHPPGGGNWSHRAVYKLLSEVRREGLQRSQDYIFLLEEPGELYIPLMHAYHARDYMEARWPRDGRGVRGVPLFTYLYHEYSLGYGGDSAGASAAPNPQHVLSAALNLINGKIPAAAVWTQWQPASNLHADQIRMLRGSLALFRTPAREYLMYGERLPTQPLAVPDAPVRITVVAGDGSRKAEDRLFPTVLHSGWSLPGGRIGYVFVNLTAAPVSLDFTVKALEKSRRGYRLRAFSADRPAAADLAQSAPLPHSLRLTLGANQPLFVEALPR
jgi:hypothetical protein